jgi:hypothetical protein
MAKQIQMDCTFALTRTLFPERAFTAAAFLKIPTMGFTARSTASFLKTPFFRAKPE